MPFESGKSGNPGGRRKETLFRNALVMELKSAGEDMPELRKIARSLINAAAQDDAEIAKVREFIDRLDGKPVQAIAGEDGSPAITIILGKDDQAL